jgi:hypothetical protein
LQIDLHECTISQRVINDDKKGMTDMARKKATDTAKKPQVKNAKKASDMAKKPKAKSAKKPNGNNYLAETLAMLTKVGFETSKTIDLMTTEIERIPANQQLLTKNTATLNALTLVARAEAHNIDFLMQRLGSIASHLIAVEEVIAEIAPAANLDIDRIVTKIRGKIAAGTDGKGDPAKAIEIATLLISR